MNNNNNDIIREILSGEFLEKIRTADRDFNAYKYNAFKAILTELHKEFKDDPDVRISAAMLDKLNPTSGWITIESDSITFTNLKNIKDAVEEISNVSVETDINGNIVISIMIYGIIEIEGIDY